MKIWTISDTHGEHDKLIVPEGVDMVVHAGDMGTYKDPHMNLNGMLDSLRWYRSLPIKYKVLIAGNHCTSIERGLVDKSEFTGIHFLNHEYREVGGLKIFGSPYTPEFHNWAYNVPRSRLEQYWKDIPGDLDILITHGPPQGILDLTINEDGHPFQCGCKSLLNRIKEVKPRFHIFGHIHPESGCPNAGILKVNGMETTFINACVVNLKYKMDNNGFVIEV